MNAHDNHLQQLLKMFRFFGETRSFELSKAVDMLLQAFPDADDVWLYKTLEYYHDRDAARLASRVSQKILEDQGGLYPKQRPKSSSFWWSQTRSVLDNDQVAVLNSILVELVARFPDASVSFLRSTILSTPSDHVHIITDSLLSLPDNGYPKRLEKSFTSKDMFRSADYTLDCHALLTSQFPHIWKSTIASITAECNDDYRESYRRLSELKAGSFWKTWSSIAGRKPSSKVSNPELAIELESVIREEQAKLELKDLEFAARVNSDEYLTSGHAITCGCCFSETAFEQLGQCTQGHLFCFDCVEHVLQEGLYGQGQLRGKSIVPCFSSDDTCTGSLRLTEVERCVPADLYKNYQLTIFEKNILDAGLSTARCPFCPYVEEFAPPSPLRHQLRSASVWLVHQFKTHGLPVLVALVLWHTFHQPQPILTFVGFSISSLALFLFWESLYFKVSQLMRTTFVYRLYHKIFVWNHPNILNCKAPGCEKVSCIDCHREWGPLHDCFGNEKDSLRVHVEQAMSEALIRICPSCHIRFSKQDGCNKMTCPNCGYSMCYICRRDISREKYAHFCQHFRVALGPCDECDRCDLYYHDADRVVLKNAAVNARKEWLDAHPEFEKLNALQDVMP